MSQGHFGAKPPSLEELRFPHLIRSQAGIRQITLMGACWGRMLAACASALRCPGLACSALRVFQTSECCLALF